MPSPAGKAAGAPAAAGDVLQYTVTVTNNGTAPAYDVDVLDSCRRTCRWWPARPRPRSTGSRSAGFVAQPTVLPSGALVWGAQNGDGLLDIPVGATLVLSYRANVLSANGTPITNSAYTDWASLNGGVAGERNGAGCPNVTAPNTYCAGPATSTVTAIDPTALAKAVVSDTWTTAPSTASDATLRVGDTVVYTLTATLREGTTQQRRDHRHAARGHGLRRGGEHQRRRDIALFVGGAVHLQRLHRPGGQRPARSASASATSPTPSTTTPPTTASSSSTAPAWSTRWRSCRRRSS